MKSTKAFLFTAFVAGTMVSDGSAFAQDSTATPAATPMVSTNDVTTTPHGKSHGASIDSVMQKLNLSDDQKTQVQPILKAERQKMKDLRNDSSLSTDDRKAKMKEVRKDAANQLQSILTQDQFAQWKSMNHGHHAMPQAATPDSTNAPTAQ
jgi:Spy/CpxP family protein refolding chaperone